MYKDIRGVIRSRKSEKDVYKYQWDNHSQSIVEEQKMQQQKEKNKKNKQYY